MESLNRNLRLLLATEHTEFDAGAEQVAIEWSRRSGLPLEGVMPRLGNPEFEVAAPGYAARLEAEAGERAGRAEEAARAAGVQLSVHVRSGPELYAEIVEHARECAADLIVIRRRGKQGVMARLMFGDMVGKVIAHAPCSVLVVPRAAKLWTRRVIVAIDPDAPWMGPIDTACAVARSGGLPVTVVSVARADEGRSAAQASVDAALARVRAAGLQAEGQVDVSSRTAEAIVAAATQAASDVLVVGRHGGESGRHAWIGGVTQKVIGLSELPVIIHIATS